MIFVETSERKTENVLRDFERSALVDFRDGVEKTSVFMFRESEWQTVANGAAETERYHSLFHSVEIITR